MFGKGHFGLSFTNISALSGNQWDNTAQPTFATAQPGAFTNTDLRSNVGRAARFVLDSQTNSPLVQGPERENLGKFATPRNPLAMEMHNKKMEAPPNVKAKEKAEKYRRMLEVAASPEEKQAIEIARMQNRDEAVSHEIDAQFTGDFQNWLMKRGRRIDHERSGWWPTDQAQPPKFLKSGGLLSEHPSVKEYCRRFALARTNFEHELVRLKVEAETVGVSHWSLEKLYMYYKFIVRGLEPDEDDYWVYADPATVNGSVDVPPALPLRSPRMPPGGAPPPPFRPPPGPGDADYVSPLSSTAPGSSGPPSSPFQPRPPPTMLPQPPPLVVPGGAPVDTAVVLPGTDPIAEANAEQVEQVQEAEVVVQEKHADEIEENAARVATTHAVAQAAGATMPPPELRTPDEISRIRSALSSGKSNVASPPVIDTEAAKKASERVARALATMRAPAPEKRSTQGVPPKKFSPG